MREDQRTLAEALRDVFPWESVVAEWQAFRNEVGRYSPRVDIAVGPFATAKQHYTEEYDKLGTQHQRLLTSLHGAFVDNVSTFCGTGSAPSLESMSSRNPNARCFMAIEIEGSGSGKHIMGGVINACALGRYGVSLASSQTRLRTLLRVRQYMLFLEAVGKNRFDPTNSLLLTTHQFADALGVKLDAV